MIFPANINRSECYYCQQISKYEKDYPLRKGKYSFEGVIHRCLWHSRFQCAKCKKFHHFSYLYWCPSTNEIICGKCSKSEMYPVKFWNKTYAYAFRCQDCDQIHFDLLYSEFKGTHPWQIHKKQLYSSENPLTPIILNERFPWDPIWKPVKHRDGKEITLEEALKMDNIIHKIINQYSNIRLHSEVIPDAEVDFKDTKKKWESTSKKWIEIYAEKSEDIGDSSREFIIDPALWKQLGDIEGLKILDAGCGNGYLSRQLARKGAEVTGIDFSSNFITHCKKREREENLGCKFVTGSLTDMKMFTPESFDVVVSNIVMVDVQDYQQAFHEINRVLKQKGRFVWSNLHPVFGSINQYFLRVPADSARNEERICSMIDQYFNTGAILMSWGKIRPIWQFHRTLQEYTQALNKAGFLIKELIEPKATEKDIRENPRTLAFESDRIPYFMIYDCVKA